MAAEDKDVKDSAAASRGSRRSSSTSSTGDGPKAESEGIQQQVEQTAQQIRGLFRRASLVGTDDAPKTASLPKESDKEGKEGKEGEEVPAAVPGQSEEDTMKNLRKTFAGIFGDM